MESSMAAGHLISIVDDDVSMRDALVGLARALGYDARGFASAEDFLACNDLSRFSCTITDIQMPGMNGFDLKRRLDEHHIMPVIMITARSDPGLKEQAISVGAVCFLHKPFDTDVLIDCLKRALPA
jgi:FixJ family two-component response regulator